MENQMEQKTEHWNGIWCCVANYRDAFFSRGLGSIGNWGLFWGPPVRGTTLLAEGSRKSIFPRSLKPEQPRISFLPVQTVMSRFCCQKLLRCRYGCLDVRRGIPSGAGVRPQRLLFFFCSWLFRYCEVSVHPIYRTSRKVQHV